MVGRGGPSSQFGLDGPQTDRFTKLKPKAERFYWSNSCRGLQQGGQLTFTVLGQTTVRSDGRQLGHIWALKKTAILTR